MLESGGDELVGCTIIEEVGAHEGRGSRAPAVELPGEALRGRGRGSIMNEDACPGGVQGAGDLRSDAPRTSRDQDGPVLDARLDMGRHARVTIPDCPGSGYR